MPSGARSARVRPGVPLPAGWRGVRAAAAIAAVSVLLSGVPAVLASEGPASTPRESRLLRPGLHAGHPLGALDAVPAQATPTPTPTPNDEIPDVSLTLGGASHTVDVEGYFSESVNAYEVKASPNGIVRTSRSGTVITIEPLAVGTATITVTGKKPGNKKEKKRFDVTVSAQVSAPTPVGSIDEATITEGGTHDVDASDYFSGDSITYTASSSDTAAATVAVSGATVTVTAVAVGSTTVTVTATNSGGSATQSFTVTVVPPAPTAVGSIAAATVTRSETHTVTASTYFTGESLTYTAFSSDTDIATVSASDATVTVTAVAVGSATVTVTATNSGGSATQSFTVTVVPPAPTAVGSIAAATVTRSETHTVTASTYFTGESLTYTAASSDTDIATVSASDATVTVTAVAVGSATVTVTATNSGGSATQSFAVTVVPPAPTAVGSIAAATVTRSETHTVTASTYFTGESLAYTASSSDTDIATVSVSGATVTVTGVAVGSATMTVTATNSGGSATQSFTVTVALPAVTLTRGGTTLAIELSDHFVSGVTGYAVAVSPAGVVQTSLAGSLLTLAGVAVGSATVTVTATSSGGSTAHGFVATVVPPAPTTVGSVPAVTLAGRESHAVAASSYFSGDSITYTASSSSTAVATVSVSGATVTVTAEAAGSATVRVTATNGGGSATQSVAVTVRIPSVSLVKGGTATRIELADYFGDDVTAYDISANPTGIAHLSRSGSALTLTALAVGSATVTVKAKNAAASATQSFAVTVVPPAPTAKDTIAKAKVTRGETHAVTASTYFTGESLTYTASSSKTSVATVATSDATVTVTAVALGRATVTVTATNAGGSATQSFVVTVVPPAPTAKGTIADMEVTRGATHTVTASDHFDGESLTYTASSSDADIATVATSGATVTVRGVAVGSATVTVTAANSGGSATQSFVVTVVPPAPTLESRIPPAKVTRGETHTVTASDHFDGESLTCTASSSDTDVATVSVSRARVTVTAVAAGSATVTVTATNGGGSATQWFVVTVVPPAPTAKDSIAAAKVTRGETHSVTASDHFDGESVTYTASSSNEAIATVAVSGETVTVTALAVGRATVTVIATNSGGKARQTFVVTVVPPAPEATKRIPAAKVTRGKTHTVTASDHFDGESVTYTASSSNEAIATVAVSGETVTVTAKEVGRATVAVTAKNDGGSATQWFVVTVVPPAPTAKGTIDAAKVTRGETHSVTASDHFDGESVTYTASSSNEAIATVAVPGETVTVTAEEVGRATVTVIATNSGGKARQTFVVTVVPPAPTLERGIEAAKVTRGKTHTVTASDHFDGESVTYTASSSNEAIATVSVSGETVMVTAEEVGRATVTVIATNSGGKARQTFVVTVVPPAPTLERRIPPAKVTRGETHTVTASDHFDGESVTYTASSSDTDVVTVAVSSATVTVTAVAVGWAVVRVEATNGGGSARQWFAVTVVPPPPVAVGATPDWEPREGGAARQLNLHDYFSGTVEGYRVEAEPEGVVHVWESGGRLTLTPLGAGAAAVTVTASNAGGSATHTLAFTVRPRPPRSLGPLPLAAISEGAAFALDAAAYFDGEGVTYAARSSDRAVATVEPDGGAMVVRAVAVGAARVTVTAANVSGSVHGELTVVVSPGAPRTAGRMADLTLAEGAPALEIDLREGFAGSLLRYGATAAPGGVAHVWESAGRLTLTPLAAGVARITAWAANRAGIAVQTFEAHVGPSAPAALRGGAPLTLAEGGAARELDLADYFGGAVERYELTASPGGIVHLWQSGGRLRLTPLSSGAAAVTVTALSGEGRAQQTFAVEVRPDAPRPLGRIAAVALTTGDASEKIDLADYFSGEVASYEVATRPDGVAHLWESGGRLRLTPLSPGVASVSVTAANASGRAGQVFAVAVDPAAPRPLGRIEGVTLREGGTGLAFDLADHFSGAVARYELSADPGGVAHPWESDGRLTLTPLSPGGATITLIAANAGGRAGQAFAVTVAPLAPMPLGRIEDVTLAGDGEAREIDLGEYFSGVIARHGSAVDPAGVVRLRVSSGRLMLTPLDAGAATVTVTASNESGSASQEFAVAVEPPAAADP